MAKSASPLTRGLLPFRIGLWIFSYGLFYVLMLVGGASGVALLLWMIAGAALGVFLDAIVQVAIDRSSAAAARNRFLFIAACVLLLAAAHAFVDALTLGRYLAAPQQQNAVRYILFYALQSFTFLLWIHAFYAACSWLVDTSITMIEKEQRLAKAEAEAQKATLRALRAQINPHFLFNALNAAASLVATGRNKEAEDLIDRLSEFFRSSLVGDRRAMISLAEEFDTLDSYLQIELLRFPDRLHVDIACPPGLASARVPNFLLQPLVENAIKHAVAPSSEPVCVRVEARALDHRLALSVENTADAAAPLAQPGAGVGLSNVRERLTATYGDTASLRAGPTPTGFRVDVEMPLELSLAEPA